jgi:hypothetical protein
MPPLPRHVDLSYPFAQTIGEIGKHPFDFINFCSRYQERDSHLMRSRKLPVGRTSDQFVSLMHLAAASSSMAA